MVGKKPSSIAEAVFCSPRRDGTLASWFVREPGRVKVTSNNTGVRTSNHSRIAPGKD